MTADELRAALRAGGRDREEPFVYLSEVALTLGERAGTRGLVEIFAQVEDVDAARAIVFALAESAASTAGVQSFLRALVDDEREFVAAEALDGLEIGQEPLEAEAVERLSQHPSEYVRGALLRYRARVWGRSAVPFLIAGLSDPSHIVRQNAVDELEALGVQDAVPQLRRMLDDCHPDVREAARYALQTLASN